MSYLEEKMKQEREEAEKALALQRQLYETKLQEAMDMNTSNLSSSSSSEHSELSSLPWLFPFFQRPLYITTGYYCITSWMAQNLSVKISTVRSNSPSNHNNRSNSVGI